VICVPAGGGLDIAGAVGGIDVLVGAAVGGFTVEVGWVVGLAIGVMACNVPATIVST
jgi:hypothetical protein